MFVPPKRLGWKRTVDILKCVGNEELVAGREEEADYENGPEKVIGTNERIEWKGIKKYGPSV